MAIRRIGKPAVHREPFSQLTWPGGPHGQVHCAQGQVHCAWSSTLCRNFTFMLLRWLFVALSATFISSMIRFFESHLAMRFRTRLARYAYASFTFKIKPNR